MNPTSLIEQGDVIVVVGGTFLAVIALLLTTNKVSSKGLAAAVIGMAIGVFLGLLGISHGNLKYQHIHEPMIARSAQ